MSMKIYVVRMSIGEYSAREEHLISAFRDEANARQRVEHMNALVRLIIIQRSGEQPLPFHESEVGKQLKDLGGFDSVEADYYMDEVELLETA